MRIYFTASLRGNKNHFKRIVEYLQDLGHNVESDHVLKLDSDFVDSVDDDYRVKYYRNMLKTISSSDMVVAEVTESSTSIGHEVTVALEKGKPVVGLCYKDDVPTIFKAIRDERFHILTYDDTGEKLERDLKRMIKKAQKTMDIRFNFFISPEIARYLDWLNKYKRIPRSVYLRDLIEKEMEENTEYKEFKAS